MDLVLEINPKFGQGGEGVQITENFADVLYVWPLRQIFKVIDPRIM